MHSFKKYLSTVDTVLGASRGAARLATVLGVEADAKAVAATDPVTALAPSQPSATTRFLRGIGATRDVSSHGGVTIAGAAVGAFIGHRFGHPVLGAIGAASLARNVPALMRPMEKNLALRNMTTTAGGILGAALIGGGPVLGVLGFLGGSLLGGLAAYWGGWRE